MMGRVKMIYATILAAIYVAASLLSPLSVLCCDHPHHTHHASESVECSCGGHHSVVSLDSPAFSEECCDHDHVLLSDIQIQITSDNERDSSASHILYTLLASVAIVDDAGVDNISLLAAEEIYRGDEALPLRAAFSRYDSLRAPPVLA
jgi:hypothetical protein